MSLVKSPTMTERKITANHRNARFSRGPTTAEGKARIAAAQLRHGFYARAQNAALRGLGEDPAHFQELLAALYEDLLLKIQRREEGSDALEATDDAGLSHDVIENKTTYTSDRGMDQKAESLESKDLAHHTGLGSDAGRK